MNTMLWGLAAAPLVTMNLLPWLPRWWMPIAAGTSLALLSVTVHARFGGDPALAAWWWLALIGTVLALVDSVHHRLPHPLLVILGLGGLAVFGTLRSETLGRLFAASAVVLLLGLIVQWALPDEVGFGDTLLLVALTPFWAWSGWATVLTGLITSHLVLGVFAAVAWLAGVRGPGARIAAGPGLVLGAWVPLLA